MSKRLVQVFQVTNITASTPEEQEKQKYSLLVKIGFALTISAMLGIMYDQSFRSGDPSDGVVVNNVATRHGREIDIQILSGPFKGMVATDRSMSTSDAAQYQSGVHVNTQVHESMVFNQIVANHTRSEPSPSASSSKGPKF